MSYERYRDWFEEAIDDFEAATELFKVGKWSKVCFLSHQTVEKALKSLMIKELNIYRHTHSIAELLREIGNRIEFPQELRDQASRLDRHYIPTRYPNAWPALPPHKHYSKEDAEEALNIAKSVIDFVKKRF